MFILFILIKSIYSEELDSQETCPILLFQCQHSLQATVKRCMNAMLNAEY